MRIERLVNIRAKIEEMRRERIAVNETGADEGLIGGFYPEGEGTELELWTDQDFGSNWIQETAKQNPIVERSITDIWTNGDDRLKDD